MYDLRMRAIHRYFILIKTLACMRFMSLPLKRGGAICLFKSDIEKKRFELEPLDTLNFVAIL